MSFFHLDALSLDGTRAITADFRCIENYRPGYGYAGLKDPNEKEPARPDRARGHRICRVDRAT
jgi:hypothetical protein